MESQKYTLKWNDFQQTVSTSFKAIRKEKDYIDVTLVSDDGVQFQAHKLVLSACSQLFKSILKKSPNVHPLIYLSEIRSIYLQPIMDYIYQGEVELYQDQLEEFLRIAQKLQIEGLNEEMEEEMPYSVNKMSLQDDNYKVDEKIKRSKKMKSTENGDMSQFDFPITKIEKVNLPLSSNDNIELDQKLEEMIGETDGFPSCTFCGKIAKNKKKSDLRKHIETHFDGLSFPCLHCDKTFRSRNSLQFHLSKNCKSLH